MRSFTVPAILAVAVVSAGCSDSNGGTANPETATVAFNVATQASLSSAVPMLISASDTLTDGSNTLVIDTAQVVIRDLKFHLVETAQCNDDGTGREGDDDNGGDNHGGRSGGDDIRVAALSDDGDCDELHLGPYLLDLPLGAGPARQFTLEVPAGSYREVRFKVQKPDDRTDGSFISAHPELARNSIRVVGSYNGAPFIFTSDANESQETEFNPPLVVESSGGTDLTLFVDIATWFRVGGTLVDPSAASDGSLGNAVRDNIKASLRAFEDRDRDGHDDGGHGRSGGNHG